MEILQHIILIFAIYYVEAKYLNVDYHYDEDAKVWLKLHRIKTTWHDARKMCNLEGAILASPLDEPLKDSLNNYTKAYGIDRIHIGIHSTFSSKLWHSIEGIPLQMLMDHLDVAPLENSDHSCGVLEDRFMVSGSCQKAHPYICYKRDKSDLELTSCGTVDKDYVLDERTGSCYKFHIEAKPWVEAYKTCFAEQAYLAIINNNAEVQVLKEIFARHPSYTIKSGQPDVMSIGFVDWEHNKQWYTIHGERLEDSGYSLWEKGEPNNAGGNEYCGNVNREGFLNDEPCYKECAFVCEKDVRLMHTNDTTNPMPSESYTIKSMYNENLYTTDSVPSEHMYTTTSAPSDRIYMTKSQQSESLYTTTSQLSDNLRVYMTKLQQSDRPHKSYEIPKVHFHPLYYYTNTY
ncbi:unnamed protein product, partial [Brenthis ino]